MTTGQGLSTNTFGVAKWVVSADATQGTHTTIAGALASASAGDTVYIRKGAYTENLTLAGVNLVGESVGSVSITGKMSASSNNTTNVENVALYTNGDNILSLSGSVSCAVVLNQCFIGATNATGISITNHTGSSGIIITNCQYGASAGFKFFDCATGGAFGTITLDNVYSTSPVNTTASTISSGTVTVIGCLLYDAISLTGGTLSISHSRIDMSSLNVSAITNNGGSVSSQHNVLQGGTASAITITSGTVGSSCDVVVSSNTNAITGAGTLAYAPIAFGGSSSTVNATTQTVYNVGPRIGLSGGCQILSGAGSPNGSVTAPKGSLWLRTNGTTINDRAFINTDSSTTWTAITTIA